MIVSSLTSRLLWFSILPAKPLTPSVRVVTRSLSAALHLAEQGADTVLLEAREPGWGASGRNGGQVIPGLKYDPADLKAKFGEERGRQLVDFAGRTADTVFDLIDRHGMDVPHVRAGRVHGAHTEAGLGEIARRAEQWAAWGAST